LRLLPYYNKRAQLFAQKGIQDKLLTKEGIRYLLFFEVDGEKSFFADSDIGYPVEFSFREFLTRNGFHAVGFGVHTAQEKISWFAKWKSLYPNSDYFINRSVLRPHSLNELEFIVEQAYSIQLVSEPMTCTYYRDKAVFENFENNRIKLS